MTTAKALSPNLRVQLDERLYLENIPYLFGVTQIATIEEFYKAKYMGTWSLKNKDGYHINMPVEVFYQPNPDVEKGHTEYFALYYNQDKELRISDGSSAFEDPIYGVVTDSGKILISRFRHDYVTEGSYMVDGGRDYFKRSARNETVELKVHKGNFKLAD